MRMIAPLGERRTHQKSKGYGRFKEVLLTSDWLFLVHFVDSPDPFNTRILSTPVYH